jgi:alkyldihydroxyacetonephosphate synthase
LLKWNGWGYRDTRFQFNNESVCEVTGDRYKISGHKLPILRDWFISIIGASLDRTSFSQPEMTIDQIPNMIINESFINDLKQTQISHSDDPQDRLFRAHGLCYFLFNFIEIHILIIINKVIQWTNSLF